MAKPRRTEQAPAFFPPTSILPIDTTQTPALPIELCTVIVSPRLRVSLSHELALASFGAVRYDLDNILMILYKLGNQAPLLLSLAGTNEVR